MFWECRLSMIHLKYAHVGFTAFVSAVVGASAMQPHRVRPLHHAPSRAKQRDALHQETMAQHRETMAALNAQHEALRELGPPHIVGAAQCSLIGYGLYVMRQASKQRDALHQETM